MQSPTFFVTESEPRFHHHKQLTVTEAGRAVKVETDLPHLVSLGSGRFSTAVTLHPLPEGKTTVGCMNADIIIRGRGIHPEHCYFVHERDVIILFPISQLITVDGAKVNRPTVLSQGTMICFGRSSYFRFNHPVEAQQLKEEHFDIYNETYSTSDLFSKREPLYANEEMSNSSTTSTTEGSLSIPLYDNVSEIKASKDKRIRNGDSQSTICDSSSVSSSNPGHSLSRYREDHGACSPQRSLSPFLPEFMVFPDGSRRVINDQFFDNNCMTTSDFFDEKASHIPRPTSPPCESLTVDNWSGYDNILELKEAMKKQEIRDASTPERNDLKEEKQSLKLDVHLGKYNDRLNPSSVGVFIGDIERNTLKMEHDLILKKQTSEPLDKRKVTFSIKEEDSANPTANNLVISQEAAAKPPSGKHAIEHLKKQETKKDKKLNLGKKNTSADNEIPATKPSFFKSFMRSRSPSPSSKRSPSPTAPIHSDVAKRLSEPFKKSFKSSDLSLKEKFIGMKSTCYNSSSSDEESVNSKSSINISPPLSSPIPLQSDSSNKTQDASLPSQDCLSSERVVTIHAINTTDDEKSGSNLLTDQPQPIICNPWKVNLKSCNVNIRFDNHKGEKLFSRDTVTTSVTVPTVSAYQAICSGSSNPEVSSDNGMKPITHEIHSQSKRKRNIENPIYDCVYDDAKKSENSNSLLDGDSSIDCEKRFSEEVFECLEKAVKEDKSFDKKMLNCSFDELKKISNKNINTNLANSSTASNPLIKITTNDEIDIHEIPPTETNTIDTRSDDHARKENNLNISESPLPTVAYISSIPTSTSVDVRVVPSVTAGKSQISVGFSRSIDDDETLKKKNREVVSLKKFVRLNEENCSVDNPNPSSDPSRSVMRVIQDDVIKPLVRESSRATVDEDMAALFGVRRGVLRRMKILKHKLEEIEEKEKNIENLITRNSMHVDVLEMKQISEKDIKEFFTNATNVLENLEEEGKKIENQFVEANEYLTRIDNTIGEMERKKMKKINNNENINNPNNSNNNSNSNNNNNNHDNNNDNHNNNNHNISNNEKNDNDNLATGRKFSFTNSNHGPTAASDSIKSSTTLDIKISSGSSDNSSASTSLLDKSFRNKKTNGSPDCSINLSDKSTAVSKIRNSTCRPLTRYFPVTDSSFDLKCYIELSGHNLDISKTVFVEKYRCCGYLCKMGRKWKKWHKRWFVFDRTKRHLACYLNEPNHNQQPRSSYYFQSIRDVFADHLHMVKSPNPDFTFCVKLVDKNLYLMASSADAMRIWIDVLFTGAEAYQDAL